MPEEHSDEADIGERILATWKQPRVAFLIGLLVGAIAIGSIAVSPPTTQDEEAGNIGDRVIAHYEDRAPQGVTYSLEDVRQYSNGMYKVTLTVNNGATTSQESVYVSADGEWIFETAPVNTRPALEN